MTVLGAPLAGAATGDDPSEDPYTRFGGPAFSLATPSPAPLGTVDAFARGDDWLDALTGDVTAPELPFTPFAVAGPAWNPVNAYNITNRSGLPWRSGAACPASVANAPSIQTLRGAPLDVLTNFLNRDTWSSLLTAVGYLSSHRNGNYVLSAGIGFLPKTEPLNYAACNRGEFDAYFRQMGAGFVANGVGNLIIRLGWEANGDHNPWFMGTSDPGPYKACFRRAVTNIKSQAPNVTIQWTLRRDSNKVNYPAELGYPGDDYVDQIGLQFYDYYPVNTDEGVWNSAYARRQRGTGGIFGLGTFLEFARAHDKKLAIAEWGVADGYKTSGGFDNALYVRKMLEFSKKYKDSLAYESYFNCWELYGRGIFNITPTSDNPNASNTYRSFFLAN